MVVDPPLEAAATASFRLLDLPKEIRDLIYEKMLVREKIGIETVAIIGDDDETSPGIVAKAHHSRSVWSSPDYYGDEPKIMSFSLGAISRDNIYAYDTYQLIRGDSASKHGRERPYLHLYFANKQIHPYLHVFFANKQIYGEAQLTFYSKNTFAFTSVVACAAFLHDRSLETLRTIRSIKLGVEEYIFPMAGDESDALFRLQVHQMPLSDIINQQMALRDLAFHIRATVRFEYAGEDDETWDWAIRERVDYSTEKLFWIPEWVLEFSKIKNLDSLEVVWESDTPRLVGRSVRAVRQMRSAMVKNGGSRIYLRNEGIRVLMRRRYVSPRYR
ncbi:hypothetical protein BU16DRAFT_193561 [Lophium mytilinum]|uniref:Uncharacterized protein n=1 Tax=Lophium mytilinum TaxID=390894 RepID=A0A6A6R9J4_9PEZI|nr:hypothetical protein BU16DRAFT_193561 [Lophium mytilinum]